MNSRKFVIALWVLFGAAIGTSILASVSGETLNGIIGFVTALGIVGAVKFLEWFDKTIS